MIPPPSTPPLFFGTVGWALLLLLGNTGPFENGEQCGRGELTLADGGKYAGEFKGGFYHGQGLMTMADGSTYDGEWSENVKAGTGVMEFSSGNRYEGEWANDNMDGA